MFPEPCSSKLILDCSHTFLIDLTGNGISFGAKSIGIWLLQSKVGLNQPDSENIFLRDTSVRV